MLKETIRELENIPLKFSRLERDHNRKLMRKGMLKKMNPYGKIQDRFIVLLSDMLIYAKKKIGKKKAEWKGMIPLDVCLVCDIGDPTIRKSSAPSHFRPPFFICLNLLFAKKWRQRS